MLLVVPLVLGGCTSEDGKKPAVLPSLAPPAALPSAVPVPSIPAEASAETAQGASAFARFYFQDVVNGAYASGVTGPVAALSDDECNSCKNIIGDVERLTAAGSKVEGRRFNVQFAETAPPGPDGKFIVDVRYAADRYLEVDSQGSVVRDVAAQVKDAQVLLVRDSGGWLVGGIQTVTT